MLYNKNMRKLKKNTELRTQYSVSSTAENPIVLKPTRQPPKSSKEWKQALEAFEDAYRTGASDPEALLYVERLYPTLSGTKTLQLLKSTLPVQVDPRKTNFILYDQEQRAEILAHFADLQKTPLLKARLNVINSIEEGDLDTSKWYLERKAKQEFSTKNDTTISAIVTPALTLEERDEILEKVFEKYKK